MRERERRKKWSSQYIIAKRENSKCNFQSTLEVILLWRPALPNREENKRKWPVAYFIH
jgi:hypothetical protein